MTEQKSSQRAPLHIDVVSDVVCPWCYIGKHRLEQALAQTRDIAVEVQYRPFFLNPWIPAAGIDRKDYLEAKFGSVEGYARIAQNVAAAAQAEGLTYNFETISRQPSTVDCHRLILWAEHQGRAADMKQRLMELYFRDGADLTDREVLIEAAAVCDLDPVDIRARLASNADIDVVTAAAKAASDAGVSGVPTFVIAGRFAVSGAQPADQLAEAIRQVAASEAEAETAASLPQD